MTSRNTTSDPTTTPRGVWAPEYADRIRALDGIVVDAIDPTPEAIAAMDALGQPMGPAEAGDLTVADVEVPGPHGPVPVRVYAPRELSHRSGAALVWMHGGGFIGGDIDMPEADAVARGVALRTGACVVSVDYRLCVDGVHHPVPHDDCWAVFRWVATDGLQLGTDPARIAVGGASAGGNLAASLALRARDEGVELALSVLIYPVLHPHLPTPDAELAACLAQTPEALRFPPNLTEQLNENLLGGPVSSATPYAFPGLAQDLAGMAPSYIEACEFDELRSSAERFAEQLHTADAAVEYVVAAGVPHGHLNNVGSPYALATIERISDRINALGGAR